MQLKIVVTTMLTITECTFYFKRLTHLSDTNPNESYSAVVRSNQAVLAAASGDKVVAEVNEVCISTQNEALFEECDNFQHCSSTYV